MIFSCEIAMTLFQAQGIRAHVDWSRVRPLLIGAAIATIPSVTVMARLGEDQARLAISAVILVLSLVLLSGWQLRRPIGFHGNLSVGVLSGMVNSAGVGGLPTAAFLTAQPLAPTVFRATMIVFLTGIDVMALPVMHANGLTGTGTLTGVMLAFPILGLGIWAGGLRFSSASQAQFRRMIVILLTLFSALNILKVAL